ncbi:MAG TPA: sigma-70 family RNA polymerase sigma factor [Thermoanaerobaculia bacterium]|jgi:RNA polymerase sigma factor (sigma-70 family)|nr:sigma-70 family RNA polymerase sigma factor [Thermoanaerobaculia bacterium]
MSFRTLFEEHIEVIERAIARVCREVRLDGAAAEDFASSVRVALLKDDCAILRSFEGRSSLPSFLTIVVRRLFIDERRLEGRFYSSAEAQRRGPAAVQLERLIMRDRVSFAEAAEIVRRDHAQITRQELEQFAAALPPRVPRAVVVPVLEGDEDRFASDASAADLVDAIDIERRSKKANDAVHAAMSDFTLEDRLILRLRFSGNASIVSIARSLGLEQRPLYRRIESLLVRLRGALEAAGVDAASAGDLIGFPRETLDFGLGGKNGELHPSAQEEGQ